MKISLKWLKKYVNIPDSPKKVANLITMHSFEVDSIEKREDDWVLDLKVLPDRAHDALSFIGVARDLSAILNTKLKNEKTPELRESGKEKTSDFLRVSIRDRKLCPRYCARIIKGVQIKQSPKWLRESLEAIGQKSINNVVDATNYVMFETGQPLHAFDMGKVKGEGLRKEIVVRRAKMGEHIQTLDNENYKLDSDTLIIADSKKPLAIAGIKGGKRAEINQKTKNIILEAANFNAVNIRLTSCSLDLRTESSLRFEHDLSAELASEAIDRVVYLIQKIAGGEILTGKIDKYYKRCPERVIGLNLGYLNSLLGISIPLNEVLRILKSLGFKIKNNNSKNRVIVKVPYIRLDVSEEEDLIEEVGRIYGYEKIKGKIPSSILIPASRNEELYWKERIKDILQGFGLTEVINYSFVGEEDLQAFAESSDNYIGIENPINVHSKYMRKSLIPGLLKNTRENFKHFENIAIFEIGGIYVERKGKTSEMPFLAGIISSRSAEGHTHFYEIKGILDGVLDRLGITDYSYSDSFKNMSKSNESGWKCGSAAALLADNEIIGFLGEINGDITSKYGIKERVFAFNLDVRKIIAHSRVDREFKEIPKYPSLRRDIAIIVDINTKISSVQSIMYEAGKKLVEDIDLFDIYQGENIPEGKKSLAFHIVYRSEDHTLNEAEVDMEHKMIIKALEKELNAQVRK